MKTIRDYVEEKAVKRKELLEHFAVIKEFQIERGDLSCCGNCGDVSNIARLPSEVWTEALYCWRCGSITMMYPADRMGGNHTDSYEVFGLKL